MPYPLLRASVPTRPLRDQPLVWAWLVAITACTSPSYGNLGDGAAQSSVAANAPIGDAARPLDGQAPGSTSSTAEGPFAASSDAGLVRTRSPDGAAEGLAQDPTDIDPADTVLTDASVPTTPTLPLWATPLVGKYAVQAFSSKEDEYLTVTVSQQLMLVEFVRQGGGLQLHSTTCKSAAESKLAQLLLVDPSALPEQVSDVVFSETDQRWSIASPMLAFGFTAEAPEICTGKQGENVMHTPAQVWLSSTCRCPLPNEDPALDDCRILDPDHDHHPGVTYTLRGKTNNLADVDVYAAGVSNSRYTNGQVSADGKMHTANVLPAEKAYQLDCNPTGCANITGLGKSCPASKNHAQFVRLDPSSAPAGGFTCADIVSRAATLFTDPAPSLDTTTCL